MSEHAEAIIELLGELRPADRRAILKRLTAGERRKLEALARPSADTTAHTAPAPIRITNATCSPWLAHRLRAALEGKDATAATCEAVHAVLSGRPGTPGP